MNFSKKVLELNPLEAPLNETDFYKWLHTNRSPKYNRLEDKRAYLESIGFEYGVDKLDEDVIYNLNYIHSHHFINERKAVSKVYAYQAGHYRMPVPPVTTAQWTLSDWINFIDAKGVWTVKVEYS